METISSFGIEDNVTQIKVIPKTSSVLVATTSGLFMKKLNKAGIFDKNDVIRCHGICIERMEFMSKDQLALFVENAIIIYNMKYW